jgi:PIN domain nuclease of toxin-antitoxin system
MKFLIDTHALIWSAYRRDRLSPHVLAILESDANEILVSAASAWEIATKYRLGKLPDARKLAEDFMAQVSGAGYLLLSITVEHALRAGRMPGDHKDPFDRMLAAQALHEDTPILSIDTQLDAFGVRREW